MKTIAFMGQELVLLQQEDPPAAALHIGERTLEVPMAWAFQRAIDCGLAATRMLEVGAVLPYHVDRPGSTGPILHRVIDPYDPFAACDQRDAETVDFTGRDVLSISTIEHMGLYEYGNPLFDPDKGWRVFEKIVGSAARYLVTFPLGYNLKLDARVAQSACPRQLYVQTSPFNTWAPAVTEDWAIAYGRPFPWANAICVCAKT